MLAVVILAFEGLAADLAGEGELGRLVRTLVYHQVVGLGEAALAVAAHELALGPNLAATEVVRARIVVDLHNREHFLAVRVKGLL